MLSDDDILEMFTFLLKALRFLMMLA